MEVITLTLLILGAAVVLFATELLPVDLTALCILCALMVTGLVEPAAAVGGFSNPATITIAAMLILSGGLQRTGAVGSVARLFTSALEQGGELRLLILMALILGPLSACINNTVVVAVFLPVIIGICKQKGLSASQFLMPLSFISIFGGVCTLIGTSTNILVSELMGQHDMERISMFEMTPIGLVMLACGSLYLLVAGRHLIPKRHKESELVEEYRLKEFMTEIVVLPGSPLHDCTIRESGLRENYGLDVLEIIREDVQDWLPMPDKKLQEGDLLLVRGRVDRLVLVKDVEGLTIRPTMKQDQDLTDGNVGLAEVVIAPRSHLVDQTLKEVDFRNRYNVTALAIQRHGALLREKVGKIRLQVGDSLLLQGEQSNLDLLRTNPDFLLVEDVTPSIPRRKKVPLAIGIVAGIILMAGLSVAPIMVLAVTGAVLMVLTGCLTLNEAYESLDFRIIFLLAGTIPLGVAMEETGTASFLAGSLTGTLSSLGPLTVMVGMYLLTILLTECMSNAAACALMVPISHAVATELHCDPRPFMMAVAFAAACSFMTPIGYQTNTLVYGPGHYRFTDFTRVGLPLSVLFLVLATVLIPLRWPFDGPGAKVPAPTPVSEESQETGPALENPSKWVGLTDSGPSASIPSTPGLNQLKVSLRPFRNCGNPRE